MANLFAQNIGLNYKGILNLDSSTINTPLDATLRAITDGDGNSSTLLLSTTLAKVSSNFIIGGATSASARLHVRGDGTNPVFRAESNAGASFVTINNSGQLLFGSAGANEPFIVNYNGVSTESGTGNALRIRQRANINGTLIQYWADGLFNNTTSGTNISHHFLSSGYAGAAGNGNYRATQIEYTINNSGAQTGTATGIFLNATETALSGMTHNLMDLQVGGASRFRISSGASLTVVGAYEMRWSTYGSYIYHGGTGFDILTGIGSIMLSPNNSLVTFLGRTNAFPALKRNAAGLDVRLADDTGFANLGAKEVSANVGFFAPNSTEVRGTYIRGRASTFMNFSSGTPGLLIESTSSGTANASAILQADSTTKGFLPPRMTTAERDLIGTPAAGLVIYNTTTNVLNFYNGTAWGAV